MIRYACPVCKSVMESPERKAGEKVPCPKCGQRIQIPAPPRSKTILGELLPTPTSAPAAVTPKPPPPPLKSAPAAPPAPLPPPQPLAPLRVLVCPSCRGRMQVPAGLAGQWLKCPSCQAAFQDMPAAMRSSAPPASAEAPAKSRPAPEMPPPLPAAGGGFEQIELVPFHTTRGTRRRRTQKVPAAVTTVLRLFRFGTPSFYILALLLFPLPWVELRYNGPAAQGGDGMIARQSGLLMLYGGLTLNEGLEGIKDYQEQMKNPEPMKPEKDKDEPMSWAPLLYPYALCLLGGAVCGLALAYRPWKPLLIAGITTVALLLILVQIAIGFPLDKVARKIGQDTAKEAITRGPGGPGGALAVSMAISTRYRPWLWINILAMFVTLPLALAEWFYHVRYRHVLDRG